MEPTYPIDNTYQIEVVERDGNTVKLNPGAIAYTTNKQPVNLLCTALSIFLGLLLKTEKYSDPSSFRTMVADLFEGMEWAFMDPVEAINYIRPKFEEFCLRHLGRNVNLKVLIKYKFDGDAFGEYHLINLGTQETVEVVITPSGEHYYTWVEADLWDQPDNDLDNDLELAIRLQAEFDQQTDVERQDAELVQRISQTNFEAETDAQVARQLELDAELAMRLYREMNGEEFS